MLTSYQNGVQSTIQSRLVWHGKIMIFVIIIFETRSGELIHMVLSNPTTYTEKMELEKDKTGNILIPFSAVIAIGDFMVISEEDII